MRTVSNDPLLCNRDGLVGGHSYDGPNHARYCRHCGEPTPFTRQVLEMLRDDPERRRDDD